MGTIIRPVDRADAGRLARRLLAAAGVARHAEVRTVSDGPLGVAFDVPDDLAVDALGGVVSDDADGSEARSEAAGDGARVVRPPADDVAGSEARLEAAEGDARVVPAADEPGIVSIADSGGPPGKTSRRSRR